MKVIERAQVEEIWMPVDEYKFNVQIFSSVDGGKTFWYCGRGKYFKDKEAAEKFAEDINKEVQG